MYKLKAAQSYTQMNQRTNRHIHALIEIFENLSRPFPCFGLSIRYLRNNALSAASFPEKLEGCIRCSFKGIRKVSAVQIYAVACLIKELLLYFTLLPAEEQDAFRANMQIVYENAQRLSLFHMGDLNGGFFENLMKNIFGISKEIIEEQKPKSFIKETASMVFEWPFKIFGITSYKNTPVERMAYSELLKEFGNAVSRDKSEILNGQSSGTWSALRELYIRTIDRTGTVPSSVNEITFILQIDKACRDYSPSLLICGGIVGSLKTKRRAYMKSVIGLVISSPESYPIRDVLKASKESEYFEIIEDAIKSLTDKGASTKDIEPFRCLLSVQPKDFKKDADIKKKNKAEIAEESQWMCEEVLLEMDKPVTEKKELAVLKKEITMINKILLLQRSAFSKQVAPEYEAEIEETIKECEDIWNRVMHPVSAGVNEEPITTQSEKVNELVSEKTNELIPKKESGESEFTYFSIHCSEAMKEPQETTHVAAETKEEKTDKPEEHTEQVASPSFIPAVNSKPSSSTVVSPKPSARTVVSIGQSEKELQCSDIRCKEYSVKEEDSHLTVVLKEVDETEEISKRPQRIEELKEYFGGLSYACFYSRNFPDPLRHLLKTSPEMYKRVEVLYNKEFTEALEHNHICVCRRSLFRDAYIELVNARENSEILNQLKDDVIMRTYMDTLKKQTLEKTIAIEKAEKMKSFETSRKTEEPTKTSKIINKISRLFKKCLPKKVPLPSMEEEIAAWEEKRRVQLHHEIVFTKNTSDKIAPGFMNVSKALVDLAVYTPGYIFRKRPDGIDIDERYNQWIVEGLPVDYAQVKANPEELKALSLVFNRYIRQFNNGIVTKYLYIAIAERAKKIPANKIDYGLGLIMLSTLGSSTLWLLKHVVYTIEQVSKYEKTNFVSYQSIVNIVSQCLLSDDISFCMDTFSIGLEIGHSLFAAVRNVSFMRSIKGCK